MTADLAVKVGRAAGTFFGGGSVALARDPRLSGPMLARAAASGMMSAGCDVIDLGIVPTPCAEYYVAKSGGLKGALVVTASHNPREFNGLKAIDARGMELGHEDEESIEAILFENRYRVAAWSEVGSIRNRGLTVVVDPGNGAGCITTPYLVRTLGCRVISLNGQADGAFPGRMPEPIPEHLDHLMRVVSATRTERSSSTTAARSCTETRASRCSRAPRFGCEAGRS